MDQQTTWWTDLIKWIEANWFQIGILGLLSKGIDRVFKYASQSRDARIRQIVKEENESLREAINELREDIGRLRPSHK